ncbi:transposase, MuDR, MULE transposase domain protein [Tanacetum coccineum]
MSDNKDHCMYVIGKKALDEGFEFKARKSDTLRYNVICKNEECKWKIISSKVKNGSSWVLGKDSSVHTLSDWATHKVMDRMQKSANWKVYRIQQGKVYQVDDRRKVHRVDLTTRSCTCHKWQLLGIPYGHVIAVGRVMGCTDCSDMALESDIHNNFGGRSQQYEAAYSNNHRRSQEYAQDCTNMIGRSQEYEPAYNNMIGRSQEYEPAYTNNHGRSQEYEPVYNNMIWRSQEYSPAYNNNYGRSQDYEVAYTNFSGMYEQANINLAYIGSSTANGTPYANLYRE